MAKNTPLHIKLNRHTGIIVLNAKEDLYYDDDNITLITHFDCKLQHLKAVYDIGIEELLKNDCFVYQELPNGYTISDFISTLKENHNHTKESLQKHLKSLLNDVVRVLEHTKEIESNEQRAN